MSGFADVNATRIVGDVAYVQPGVRMIDLGDHLLTKGLSVGFTHLGFRGVTVAGAIGTSAHGSSPTSNNAISQRVASLRVVLADGSLRTFEEASTQPVLWRALITSLGLLGVVVEVGVHVEPAFNLDVEVKPIEEDALLSADSPLSLIAGCDWGQFNWFPHHHKVFRWCGKKTSAPAQEGANNVLLDPGVGADLAKLGKLAFHAGTCAAALNELVEGARVDGLVEKPPIVVRGADGELEHTAHAVGPAHRMTSADLIELGGNKYFQMDWEVAVPQQYMADALDAARKMFDAHDVSLPGVGVFVRFGKVERGGWLSYHSAGKEFAEGETAMFFETPVAVPVGYSDVQLTDYLHIYRELIGLFVRHFGARAHWGKNLDSVFALQRSVGTYEGRIDKVNEAVAELDPYGVFANDFARRIGVTWPKQGQDFSLALGHGACSCGTEGPALTACAYRDMNVFASPCRAACAGKTASDLLPGACSALVREPCSPFETTTCVYDRKAREQNPFVEPLVRF
jgi:FAD/FMN-containing dehydrogenase